MIALILILSLTLPSSSFLFATVQMFFVCMLSMASGKKFVTKELNTLLILILLFILLSILHFIWSGSADELVDIVRFMPLLSFILLKPKLEEHIFTKVFLYVNLINLIAVYLVDNNLMSNFFEYLHARNLEQSYGRHSGILTNVSNLGIYSLLGVLFAIKKLELKTGILDLIILLTSGYLLLLSGSKTGLMLAGAYIAFVGFRMLILMRINVLSISVILTVGTLIYYWEKVKETFYVLYKIMTILTGGLAAASSVQGRFDIWIGYITLMSERFMYFIFGLPVSIAEFFSTTFDNDIIWLVVRFGVLGFFMFSYFWFKHLCRSQNIIISLVILVSSFFVGMLVSFQLCLFALCFLYLLEESPTINKLNDGHE
jgi:hypothetical protein